MMRVKLAMPAPSSLSIQQLTHRTLWSPEQDKRRTSASSSNSPIHILFS